MSQDLLSAFGEDTQPPLHGRPSNDVDSLNDTWQRNKPQAAEGSQPDDGAFFEISRREIHSSDVPDEDDFGAFEDASASVLSSQEYPDGTRPEVKSVSIGREGHLRSTAKSVASPQRPASPAKPKQAEVNHSHPFAGRMDLLFGADEDDYDAGADELGDLSSNPEAAMAYSKRIIAEQQAARETPRAPFSQTHVPKPPPDTSSGPNKLKKKSGYAPPPRNADVLFDAEDPRELDFVHDDIDSDPQTQQHSTESRYPQTRSLPDAKPLQLPAIDLLGLEDEPIEPASKQTARATPLSASDNQRPNHRQDIQAADATIDDDGWHDFEIAEPSTGGEIEVWNDFDTVESKATSALQSSAAPKTSRSTLSAQLTPPTNIPPPIILLSAFPSIFAAADDALFNTVSKLDFKQRQALLAHPASHQFLKGYLGHCTVLGHIIAGRKLRWKRDQRLSQSMRIGPAAAGGKGGMKLAGLDKAEVAKEEREVLDVLRLWKTQVGKLRAAATAASAAPGLPKLPAVPEIAETMPVKSLKQTEGGATAPHPCALCGLKREERVAKVDVDVQDSFGEFWMQGINMHVVCQKWWQEFERKLKSR